MIYTIKNTITHTVLAVMLVVAMFFAGSQTVAAQQQSTAELQAQVNQLLQVVALLQAQLRQLGTLEGGSIADTSLQAGSAVETISTLRVRSTIGVLPNNLIGTIPANTRGTIIAGPRSSTTDNNTWYQVRYANGVTGWSAGNWLRGTQNEPQVNPERDENLVNDFLRELEDSRNNARNASAQTSINNVRAAAEVHFNTQRPPSYQGLCESRGVSTLIQSAERNVDQFHRNAASCNVSRDSRDYAVAIQLITTNNQRQYYCVDSSGFAGRIDGAIPNTSFTSCQRTEVMSKHIWHFSLSLRNVYTHGNYYPRRTLALAETYYQ